MVELEKFMASRGLQKSGIPSGHISDVGTKCLN